MPTSTFFNLPEQKRNRVIRAAKDEFIRSKNGEIVIKNIVSQAGIPRGSFYQYFESKEDLVDYIMKNHMLETEKAFCEKIEKYDGDILLLFEKIFYNIIDGKNEGKLDIERKIIDHVKRFQERRMNKCCRPPKIMEENQILKYLNKSKYKIETSEELEAVFHMIMGIMMKNIIDFQNGLSEENVLKSFSRDLDYLRYGIVKNNERKEKIR